MQKNFFKKANFCWHVEGQWWKLKDPDPSVRGMDPRIRIRIRIHTKMSWNRTTDYGTGFENKISLHENRRRPRNLWRYS